MKKALLFVPFWGQTGHIGNLRVERFIRWLRDEGYGIVLVRAGCEQSVKKKHWGTEITIRDPLGLHPNRSTDGTITHRKPNALRRWLAYFIFIPDPVIVWSFLASRHAVVLEHANNVDFVLSSNPPESAHVGAYLWAKKYSIPHVMDMRDGWTDEPLRPLLRSSKWRLWLERKIESKIVLNSKIVFVTSAHWKKLLCQRISDISRKVDVITNSYPQVNLSNYSCSSSSDNTRKIHLVHAGKFIGSDSRRSPDMLLDILYEHLKTYGRPGTISLVGDLSAKEVDVVSGYSSSFNNIGWDIKIVGYLPRDTVINIISNADGLILFTVTDAQIPGKFFEYAPTGRPILTIANANSATWNACRVVPQAFCFDMNGVAVNALSPINLFLDACVAGSGSSCPIEYSDDYVSRDFKLCIRSVVA